MTFYDRIIHLKQERNLLQKDIAAGAGIGLRQYQRYEKKEGEPSMESIIKLCNFFNVSADYLLGLSNDPTPPRKG